MGEVLDLLLLCIELLDSYSYSLWVGLQE